MNRLVESTLCGLPQTMRDRMGIYAKMKVLKNQFADYKVQVEEVLSSEQCVYLAGIKGACYSLLRKAEGEIAADSAGKSVDHVHTLDELSTYLRCVSVSAATAVHANCPQIQNIFSQFRNEFKAF